MDQTDEKEEAMFAIQVVDDDDAGEDGISDDKKN